MSLITRQDSNGVKPLLQSGELGYDNYPAGGDSGRVYVGTGSENIPLAKKAEISAVDEKADVHIARVDNPHGVTKEQVGLGNVEDIAPADMPVSSDVQAALNAKANNTDADLLGVPKAPTAAVGTNTKQIANTEYVRNVINIVEDRLDVVEGVVAETNLTRADKYLASKNIARLIYESGNLTKIRYNIDSDVDYEVLTYSGEDLVNVAHYINEELKGNTVLTYASDELVSSIFIGV